MFCSLLPNKILHHSSQCLGPDLDFSACFNISPDPLRISYAPSGSIFKNLTNAHTIDYHCGAFATLNLPLVDLSSVLLQAKAVLPKDVVGDDFNIPYCSVTDCIRHKDSNSWTVGKLWDDSFLKDQNLAG